MTMENKLYDVFISGAGPVGLYFAYQVIHDTTADQKVSNCML